MDKCRDLLILCPPKTSLIGKFLCLLSLPATNLEWFAPFCSLSLSSESEGPFQVSHREFSRSLQSSDWQASQQTRQMGLGKEVSTGKVLSWPSTSMWRGVAHMSDACGPLHEYGDALKHCSKLLVWETVKSTLWQREPLGMFWEGKGWSCGDWQWNRWNAACGPTPRTKESKSTGTTPQPGGQPQFRKCSWCENIFPLSLLIQLPSSRKGPEKVSRHD